MTLGLVDFKKLLQNSYDEEKLNKPAAFNTSRLAGGKTTEPVYVARYLPLEDKVVVVNAVLSSSGYQYGIGYEVYKKYYIIKYYVSNVRFPQKEVEYFDIEEGKQIKKKKRVDDPLETVNISVGIGLWDFILEKAGKDIDYIEEMIESEMEEFRYANNAARLLESILSNVNDMALEANEKGLTNIMIEKVADIQKSLGDKGKSEMAKNLVKLLENKQN